MPISQYSIANIDVRDHRRRSNHIFGTISDTRNKTCAELFASENDVVSRLGIETIAGTRNETDMHMYFGDSDVDNRLALTASAENRNQRFADVSDAKAATRLALETTTETRNQTSPHMYVSDSDVDYRLALETTAETRSQTYHVIYVSDSALSQTDNEKDPSQTPLRQEFYQHSGGQQEARNSSSAFIDGVQSLPIANVINMDSVEIVDDSQLESTEIWDPQALSQSSRKTSKSTGIHSQRDFDSVTVLQQSRNGDKNVVLSQKSTQLTELNPPIISQFDDNLQTQPSAVLRPTQQHPLPEEKPKPKRRKLFNLKLYNELREMSPSTQSLQTNENSAAKTIQRKVNPKTIFHLTDDPYRILELDYSSDELGKNLHSKKRKTNNATRFKSFRAKIKRNEIADGNHDMPNNNYSVPIVAENSKPAPTTNPAVIDTISAAVAEYPSSAALPDSVPVVDSNTSGCKKRRLDAYEVNVPDPIPITAKQVRITKNFVRHTL